MNGNGDERDAELTEEKVTFVPDPSHADRYLPRIAVTKKSSSNSRISAEKSFRSFQADDMPRVLDFDQVPEPPPDGPVRYCDDSGNDGLKFPVRHLCLRGGYLFYFDIQDVEDDGLFTTTYRAPPLGVVPLEKIGVEYPPGGRRVFRDHAHHNDARNGYELVIVHEDFTGDSPRPPTFLVLESMSQRERWSEALKLRGSVSRDTTMRAPTVSSRDQDAVVTAQSDDTGSVTTGSRQTRGSSRRLNRDAPFRQTSGIETDEADIEQAKEEFGVIDFSESDWLDNFFSNHNDFDAPAKCRLLEQWQSSIKTGLKGAVLEQYAYFVDASREMTIMGKEVTSLKEKVEKQNECIKDMKDIEFSIAGEVGDDVYDSDDEELDPPALRIGAARRVRRRRAPQAHEEDQSDESSISSEEDITVKRRQRRSKSGFSSPTAGSEHIIEIPPWLEDVSEEISAFIKECRYTDAANLLLKAKTEISDILSQHDKPTENRLSKKHHTVILNIRTDLNRLTERMCNRLCEGLRRKNEALKQAGKRERSDPLSLMAPMVSPCCLDDDAVPLQLLVRMGKTQEAATAYAARRSLLLMESLHERPISGTGNVDLVIYAAQLSQSFFSCLASAVEGFLDLFLVLGEPNSNVHPKDEELGSYEDGSILSAASRNVPPGALAAIVLWCDSELSKFSSAFGGTRILGNLALSPPPRRDIQQSKVRMVGFEEDSSTNDKERQNSIEVAAQCVDQAFQYASENLDSIGLPLTPRLAEYIRSRLKGCESEVAGRLDMRWKHVSVDWEVEPTGFDDDSPMEERRNLALQPTRSSD